MNGTESDPAHLKAQIRRVLDVVETWQQSGHKVRTRCARDILTALKESSDER